MKRLFTILLALFVAFSAAAQSEKSIILDQNSFRPIHSSALDGVNIDPIGIDSSRNPCARIKVKINRMSREDIDKIEVKIHTNNNLTKCKTADYDNGLIIEMTAKNETRFYFFHPEFGYSNEVNINLEPNKEYYMDASLNQTYSIVVNSNTADAEVYLDGVFKGRTDASNSCTVKNVLVGPHDLKLVYDGISAEQQIEVNDSIISFRQDLNVKIERFDVTFKVQPTVATIIIDNGLQLPISNGLFSLKLPKGVHSYEIKADKYFSEKGGFTVTNAPAELAVNLKADAATVTLTAPNDAEIWVNNSKMGVGTWSGVLYSGLYTFEARKVGHRTVTLTKTITATPAHQSYNLEAPTPIFGSLNITTTPVAADIYIDDKYVGTSPIRVDNIPVGKHAITVSRAGYISSTQAVAVEWNKSFDVNVFIRKGCQVGDYYSDGFLEGVIFYVNPDGISGKLVSVKQPNDYSSYFPHDLKWTNDDYAAQSYLAAYNRTDGEANMAIFKKNDAYFEKYPAFRWCAQLGEEWYLPAVDELKLLMSVRSIVNQTISTECSNYRSPLSIEGTYWSSTESSKQDKYRKTGTKLTYNAYSAYDVDAYGEGKTLKPYFNKVLAIAKFVDKRKFIGRKTTSAPYKVGDYYNENGKEGVVFEVTPDGKHGKIIGTQSPKKMEWASDKSAYKRLIGANSWTDGAYNMAIVQAIPDWQSKYPAFKWCADLGEGWYLPACGELSFIENKGIYNDIIRMLYAIEGEKLRNKHRGELGYLKCWSSTEVSNRKHKYKGEYNAYEYRLYPSKLYHDYDYPALKSNYNYVRAVSAF